MTMSPVERLTPVSPEDLERQFVARMNDGDVEGLVALFEPDAVMQLEPGKVATGRRDLRRVFEDLVASGMQLTLGRQQPTQRVGDLALTSTHLNGGGVTAEVARRQPDGTWRWVIDRWNVLLPAPDEGPGTETG
jgi:ketosteroid isomerase-like protein